MQIFHDSVALIKQGYDDLHLTLGWRFLYSPAATIKHGNGLVFLGVNPGGDKYAVRETQEEGNSYLVEKWGRGGTLLQGQVRGLFDAFAAAGLGSAGSGEELLTATLTSNFCPYRSPTWKALPQKEGAKRVSRELWKTVFGAVRPRLVLCMGKIPFQQVSTILRDAGDQDFAEQRLPTGWGGTEFIVRTLRVWGGTRTVAFVPHLSRFKIMSKHSCHEHIALFAECLAEIHAEITGDRNRRATSAQSGVLQAQLPADPPSTSARRMSPQRRRRSPEEQLAHLKAKLDQVKARAARRETLRDPALRHVGNAVRALKRALDTTSDEATREALNEANAILAACLALHGVAPATPGSRAPAGKSTDGPPSADDVLAYLRRSPGARSQDICAALSTDAATLRRVLRGLRDEGQVLVEGRARATRYSAL